VPSLQSGALDEARCRARRRGLGQALAGARRPWLVEPVDLKADDGVAGRGGELAAVLWLAGGTYATGTVLTVDGGYTAR
jgi:hypothetical protein